MKVKVTAEQLKEATINSIGQEDISTAIKIKHLVSIIQLLNNQIVDIDKKNRRI